MVFIVRHGTLVARHPHVAIPFHPGGGGRGPPGGGGGGRGCLRNYVLVFAKKREGFCEMKNRISPI